MKSFAIVRSAEELTRACRDLGAFFSTVQHRKQDHVSEIFLGIWLPNETTELPVVTDLGARSCGGGPIHVSETVSLEPVWTLCWLDSAGESARWPSRQDLLDRLIDSLKRELGSGKFIPVFHRSTPESGVATEMVRLQEKFNGYMRAPLYLDPDSGTLSHLRQIL